MPKEPEMIEIEKGSANVYEDLGLLDAAEMQVKATLAAKIGEIVKHPPMEARLAKLEASTEHVQRDVSDIKIDIRRIRDIIDSNFKLTFGRLIFVALGPAGIIAMGFGWL